MLTQENIVESKLIKVLDELSVQHTIGNSFPADQMSFIDEVAQIRDWIVRHGEYGIAYESLVAILEQVPFILTGPTAVLLLEIGLTLRFTTDHSEMIEESLLRVLGEVEEQREIGNTFPVEMQSLDDQTVQIREYIELAGEYSIAYESLVCLLEFRPFKVSGPVAIELLEVGLLLKFKTDRPEDSMFDSRLPN
jgi:hypothetical protein